VSSHRVEDIRADAKFFFAACGGREMRRSEDTSRSARGLQPPGPLLLPDLATALLKILYVMHPG